MESQVISKVLSYLGFAARANKIVFGKDMLKDYISDQRLSKKVIIIATDTGARVKRDIIIRCQINNVPYFEIFDKETLAKAIGKNRISVIGILDESLVEAILKTLQEN
ncbi:L7Ae/L30e/S12e/Gadd45 family ribosomal protein [Fervidobacterium sp.]